MPSILDSVRAALKRPKPSTDSLAAAVELAVKAEIEAKAEVERQAKLIAGAYMDDDAARITARAALRAAREAGEDASLIRQEAEKRHAAARYAAEQARRQGLFDSAKVEAEAASDALARTYPKLAASMISMLGDLARAQQAVALANEQLPAGVAPLVDPEMAARSIPGQPREMVADEEVELWARLDQPVPVDAAFQKTIYDCENGWGKRPGDEQPAFRRRRFRKVSYREPVNGDTHYHWQWHSSCPAFVVRACFGAKPILFLAQAWAPLSGDRATPMRSSVVWPRWMRPPRPVPSR